MKSIIIKSSDAGQRIDKYIIKHYPNIPSTLMYKYFRLKRIKVNGKKCEINYKLTSDDLLELYINDEMLAPPLQHLDFITASTNIDIVYEDQNLMLLNKPEGLLCHPDADEFVDTLIARCKRYLYEKGEFNPNSENEFTPSLCNRIDRNTGGIVILAKNSAALRFINAKIKSHEIEKQYICVVHGTPTPKSALLEAFLYKNAEKNMVFIENHKTSKNLSIGTFYEVLASQNGLSLLKIRLLTGRTHQIRAQMSNIGHPLLGDGKYGVNIKDRKLGYKHQALCSYKVKFAFSALNDDEQQFMYLKNKEFTIKKIWFAEKLFPQTIFE